MKKGVEIIGAVKVGVNVLYLMGRNCRDGAKLS